MASPCPPCEWVNRPWGMVRWDLAMAFQGFCVYLLAKGACISTPCHPLFRAFFFSFFTAAVLVVVACRSLTTSFSVFLVLCPGCAWWLTLTFLYTYPSTAPIHSLQSPQTLPAVHSLLPPALPFLCPRTSLSFQKYHASNSSKFSFPGPEKPKSFI